MHINYEMLESVYFTCSMILEVPYMAHTTNPYSRHNRHFRRAFQSYCRQHFNGSSALLS